MAEPGHRFGCTLCGDCCTGNQVVRLCAGDLALLVRRWELGSVAELRTQGTVQVVQEAFSGGTVWRPRLRFRTKPLRQCPFLVNRVDDGVYRGLCSLHPHDKPLVCALSPLSREVDDPGQGPVSETWHFVAPVEGCPGVGEGERLPLKAPGTLRSRLDEEAEWMRRLIEASEEFSSEDDAWDWLTASAR